MNTIPRNLTEPRISTNVSEFNTQMICREIQNSYWAQGRSSELILKSLKNSFCFGVFSGADQVGFARVITDFATFAYLCDVFILESHRGHGFGKALMSSILVHPDLSSVKWVLRTKDAHGLYAQFGFQKTHRPERYMERALEYQNASTAPIT